jgi:uncharacterized membrane protein YqjE
VIHPLLKTLASQPELLVEHASAYAQLASLEAQQWGQQLQRRTLWLTAVALAAALLLWAATPPAELRQPWLLWAVPGLPLLLAAGGAWQLQRQPATLAFPLLREQLQQDRHLLAAGDGD